MKVQKFKLDGLVGSVDINGFIRWASISCSINSLKDISLLKQKALAAYKKFN